MISEQDKYKTAMEIIYSEQHCLGVRFEMVNEMMKKNYDRVFELDKMVKDIKNCIIKYN